MITKKEVAELLSVSIPTVDRYMKKGLPYNKIGKTVRFETQNVLDWARSNPGKEEDK